MKITLSYTTYFGFVFEDVFTVEPSEAKTFDEALKIAKKIMEIHNFYSCIGYDIKTGEILFSIDFEEEHI